MTEKGGRGEWCRFEKGSDAMGRLHRARWGSALHGLLDDELDLRQTARILGHLERCPDCLSDLEALAILQQSLRRLAGV